MLSGERGREQGGGEVRIFLGGVKIGIASGRERGRKRESVCVCGEGGGVQLERKQICTHKITGAPHHTPPLYTP